MRKPSCCIRRESRRDQEIIQQMEEAGMGVTLIYRCEFKIHSTEPRRVMAAGAGHKQ